MYFTDYGVFSPSLAEKYLVWFVPAAQALGVTASYVQMYVSGWYGRMDVISKYFAFFPFTLPDTAWSRCLALAGVSSGFGGDSVASTVGFPGVLLHLGSWEEAEHHLGSITSKNGCTTSVLPEGHRGPMWPVCTLKLVTH